MPNAQFDTMNKFKTTVAEILEMEISLYRSSETRISLAVVADEYSGIWIGLVIDVVINRVILLGE